MIRQLVVDLNKSNSENLQQSAMTIKQNFKVDLLKCLKIIQ